MLAVSPYASLGDVLLPKVEHQDGARVRIVFIIAVNTFRVIPAFVLLSRLIIFMRETLLCNFIKRCKAIFLFLILSKQLKLSFMLQF